jgi:hypothetical protein
MHIYHQNGLPMLEVLGLLGVVLSIAIKVICVQIGCPSDREEATGSDQREK